MIGHVIAAYCRGRSDAQAGSKAPRSSGDTDYTREIYLLGFTDEARRMARDGRLPQMRLELEPGAAGAP